MQKNTKRESSATKHRIRSSRVAAKEISTRAQSNTQHDDTTVATVKETTKSAKRQKLRENDRTKALAYNAITNNNSQNDSQEYGSKEVLLKRGNSEEKSKLLRKKWHRAIQLAIRINRKKKFERTNDTTKSGAQSTRNLKLSVDGEGGSVGKDTSGSVTSMKEGIIQRKLSKESYEHVEYNRFKNNNSYIRSAIPCLPLQAAIVCFILNMFIPGLGTLFSGLLVLCTGETRLENKGESQRLPTLMVNLVIGICQLLTIVLLLVGWFWSVAWGFYLIIIALEKKREVDAKLERQRSDELKLKSLKALGLNKNSNKIF